MGVIMKIKYIIVSLISLLAILLVFSCSEKKKVLEVSAHPEGWTNQDSPNFHGKMVEESVSNTQNCTSCHGKDYAGGTSGVSCMQSGCHAIYPHPEGFTNQSNDNFHGKYLANLGFSVLACADCHGADYRGDGDSNKNCFASGCHNVFPHKTGFAEESSQNFHGKFIADSLSWNIVSCQSCHGTDYKGEGYSGKNCVTCHGAENMFPHPADFNVKESAGFHGKYIAENLDFDITSCQGCHGTDYKGNGYAGKNCLSCHNDQYPHAVGFASPASANFHGTFIADNLGGDITSCATCHGSDYMGNGYVQKNCMSCHSLYPHDAEFANPASDKFHGKYIADELNFTLNSCQSCHGEDFKGDGDEQKNCYRCHAQYPHLENFDVKTSPNFHGTYVADELNYNETSCQSCHGTDYSGNGYEQKNCRACHENYPHVSGYVDTMSTDFHGKYVADDLDFTLTSCQSCHGDDFKGAGNEEKNCYACHNQYPHAIDFADKNSADFHGTYVAEDLNFNESTCQKCHGTDFGGEGYEQKNCRSCHELYPHVSGYVDTLSANFHGKYLANADWNTSECESCHGSDYSGSGYEVKNCRACHDIYPHISDFKTNTESDNFHGKYIADVLAWDKTKCATCHGSDFSGEGYPDKNCRTCHTYYPHPQGFISEASDDFHGEFIGESQNWDLTGCQTCHGSDYAGNGYDGKSCVTCHTETNGPEACNTCHGSEMNAAPPEDLAGNTSTDVVTVGAHQAHLTGDTWTTFHEISCSTCHVMPTNYSDPGHVNDGTPNAEVVFDNFATNDGKLETNWSHDTATCSNSYCHGAFSFSKDASSNQFAYADSVIVGNNRDMIWNSVGSGQADCGTCHGLPPTGHAAYPACSTCHGSVVDANNNIIDKTKHINGQIDVF
jgi:hypothetical protein